MNDLTTTRGFYETYLRLLKQFQSSKDCFEYLNQEVRMITGERMFLNFYDFKMRTTGEGLETPFKFVSTYFNLLSYFKSGEDCFEYIRDICIARKEKPLYPNYKELRKAWNT